MVPVDFAFEIEKFDMTRIRPHNCIPIFEEKKKMMKKRQIFFSFPGLVIAKVLMTFNYIFIEEEKFVWSFNHFYLGVLQASAKCRSRK